MAQYDTPFLPGPEEAPARPHKWPLAGVMSVDEAGATIDYHLARLFRRTSALPAAP